MSASSMLPWRAPESLRRFVDGAADEVRVDLDDLGWLPRPAGLPASITPTATIGPDPTTVAVPLSVAFGDVASVGVRLAIADGRLGITTNGLDLNADGRIQSVVTELNRTLDDSDRQLVAFDLDVGGLLVATADRSEVIAPTAVLPLAIPARDATPTRRPVLLLLAALIIVAVAAAFVLTRNDGTDEREPDATAPAALGSSTSPASPAADAADTPEAPDTDETVSEDPADDAVFTPVTEPTTGSTTVDSIGGAAAEREATAATEPASSSVDRSTESTVAVPAPRVDETPVDPNEPVEAENETSPPVFVELTESVTQFYDQLATSLRRGDLAFSYDRLDQRVLEVFPESCLTTLAVPDGELDVEVLGQAAPETWVYEAEGQSFVVDGAVPVRVRIDGRRGDGTPTIEHLSVVEGAYYWFTTC